VFCGGALIAYTAKKKKKKEKKRKKKVCGLRNGIYLPPLVNKEEIQTKSSVKRCS